MSKQEEVARVAAAEREKEYYLRIVNELKEFEITNEDIETMLSSLISSHLAATGKSKNNLLISKLIRYRSLSTMLGDVKIKCIISDKR